MPQEVERMLTNNNNLNAYSQPVLDACSLIRADISQAGMEPPDHIEFGKIIRFSDDSRNNKNGWCIAFQNPDGSAAASFGNWKDIQEKRFYNSNGSTITPEDKEAFSLQIQKAMDKAKNERKEKQALAAKKANEIWNNAQPADPNHAYLIKKQIESYGLKQSGKTLIIPVMNFGGEILSLQEILPDGEKKFFPGGQIKGGAFVIGDIQQNNIFYISEGYATGATIHKATNKPVIIAFNSGNLKLVAQIYRTAHPSKTIIIASDNDIETEKKIGTNPGRIAAEQAASAIDAKLCLCPVNSDFNDLQQVQGMNVVQQELKKTRTVTIEDWEQPVPLKEDHAPDLDPNLFTGIIGDMAREVSIETETPFELSAGLILSVLGTACQGKFMVKIKPGYQEPINIWTVTALDPANRKSSVLIKITKPLTQWENNKHLELGPIIKDAASKFRAPDISQI